MVKKWFKMRMDNAVCAFKQNKLYYIFALLAMLLAGMYVCIVHSHTFPFAEGWYTYYAKCIHEGLMPYRDFEYLYSPIYIYFIAFFTKIFGYDLIVLRRLGILFFALIALGIYLSVVTVVGKKRSWIALISAVAAAFYLQSEVVQLFYDYIRLMDVFAAFSLLFLLKTVKGMVQDEKYIKHLVICGTLFAFFINIKQNIGLIFFVYAFILVIYIGLWCKHSWKQILKDALYMLIPVSAVTAIVFIPMIISGSLLPFLSMTGFSAAGAKGGMQAILFGWIFNNKYSFWSALPLAIVLLICLVGLYLLNRFCIKKDTLSNSADSGKDSWIGIAFGGVMAIGLITLMLSESFAHWFLPDEFLNPYAIFLIILPIFIACGIWGIVDMARHQHTMKDIILFFALAGSYFAIAYGCGNSGGLAEGQTGFGVAFVVAALLVLLDLNRARIIRGGVVVICLLFALQCADKKMVYSYNWWGMDESTYWNSTEELNLNLTQGIKVSPETKYVYESVCRAIIENTDPEDPIFAFPQIPIFYNLCDRKDPGTFTKVQWFDVASDDSVLRDIEVLKQNPPKAIVIYNSSDYAYRSHESAFRSGNVSGARIMREFLYNYVADNGYKFYGRYAANNNSLSVWIADDTPNGVNFAQGTGTKENPYIISTPEQFQMFAEMVNAGRSFDGQYIRQSADIDMSGMEISSIGKSGSGAFFSGIYDGAGHVIRGVHLKDETQNMGLFGGLAGAVYNLGIEDSSISSICSGGIASYSVGGNAKIINCYTDMDVQGYRAGGIADDFSGRVENCISAGTLTGEEMAYALTIGHTQELINVYTCADFASISSESSFVPDERIANVSPEMLNSQELADIMNAYVLNWNSKEEPDVQLCSWAIGANGHLILITK